jgi:hypothetical protein
MFASDVPSPFQVQMRCDACMYLRVCMLVSGGSLCKWPISVTKIFLRTILFWDFVIIVELKCVVVLA